MSRCLLPSTVLLMAVAVSVAVGSLLPQQRHNRNGAGQGGKQCGDTVCPSGYDCCGTTSAATCFNPATEQCCTANVDYVCTSADVCCTSPLGDSYACCSLGNCTGYGQCGTPVTLPPTPAPTIPCNGDCESWNCCGSTCLNSDQQCCLTAPCGKNQSCCFYGDSQVKCCDGATSTCDMYGNCNAPAPPTPAPGPACGDSNCRSSQLCCGGEFAVAPVCYNPNDQQCCQTADGTAFACSLGATCCYNQTQTNCCASGTTCDFATGTCQ